MGVTYLVLNKQRQRWTVFEGVPGKNSDSKLHLGPYFVHPFI